MKRNPNNDGTIYCGSTGAIDAPDKPNNALAAILLEHDQHPLSVQRHIDGTCDLVCTVCGQIVIGSADYDLMANI